MGINKDQEKYTQNKDSSLARIIVVLIIQVCYFITFPFLSYSFPWSFTNILLISITIQAPFTTSHSISKWPIYKADSPSLPSPFLTKPIVLSNTYYPWYNRFPLSSIQSFHLLWTRISATIFHHSYIDTSSNIHHSHTNNRFLLMCSISNVLGYGKSIPFASICSLFFKSLTKILFP